MSLNPTTGEITGTPLEEYQAVFTVTYTDSNRNEMKSTLKIKSIRIILLNIIVWDAPKVLTCGITELNVNSKITESFQCESDKKVNSWSISFNPEGSHSISITNDGILKFSNYDPIEKLTYILFLFNFK